MFIEVFLDAVKDCLAQLPFLFAAFLLLEALEHHMADRMQHALKRAGSFGPLVGSLLGCVPQCGFSIMASEFYAGGVITLGTLLSVFLATSDEAVVILLANPAYYADILRLIATKVVIGLVAGYLILVVTKQLEKRKSHRPKEIEDLCGHCGCHEENGGILRPALRHTVQVWGFLFLMTLVLNVLLEAVGLENVSRLMLDGSLFQPVLAALIGLIPNCASSVILTELYMDGVISFGAATAGLCSSAGLGLIVLYRINRDKKECLKITGLLLAISIAAGLFLQLIG